MRFENRGFFGNFGQVGVFALTSDAVLYEELSVIVVEYLAD
jgi:hypothetical protein